MGENVFAAVALAMLALLGKPLIERYSGLKDHWLTGLAHSAIVCTAVATLGVVLLPESDAIRATVAAITFVVFLSLIFLEYRHQHGRVSSPESVTQSRAVNGLRPSIGGEMSDHVFYLAFFLGTVYVGLFAISTVHPSEWLDWGLIGIAWIPSVMALSMWYDKTCRRRHERTDDHQ